MFGIVQASVGDTRSSSDQWRKFVGRRPSQRRYPASLRIHAHSRTGTVSTTVLRLFLLQYDSTTDVAV